MTQDVMPLLEARGLSLAFGGVRAVDQVDFTLEKGEIHALIGPNGAGKTSFVGLLSGRMQPVQGAVLLEGRDITALSPQERVKLGIGYTFQVTSIFPQLSIFDNVALALQGGRLKPRDLQAEVTAILTRVGLLVDPKGIAAELSYGHQRQLELAMGLALGPRVLILDEPTQGLASGEIAHFIGLVKSLVPEITVLMIEHNMEVVMQLATRITVLSAGRVLASGSPEEIRGNRVVQEAYLGE